MKILGILPIIKLSLFRRFREERSDGFIKYC